MTRYLTQCAAAYAAGDTVLGERLFAKAHAETMPLVKRTVLGKIGAYPRIDIEAVVQEVMFALWRACRDGREPEIVGVAFQISVDTFRKEVARTDGRTGKTTQRPTHAHIDAPENQNAVNAHGERDHATNADSSVDMERLAHGLEGLKPSWKPIMLLAAQGLAGAHEIADALGRPRGTVRRELVDIRRHLRGETEGEA